MATSLARELLLASHACLGLLLLTAIARLSIGLATPIIVASTQHANAAAGGGIESSVDSVATPSILAPAKLHANAAGADGATNAAAVESVETPNVDLACAQNANAAAGCTTIATALTTPELVDVVDGLTEKFVSSDDVLVFQTSLDLACILTRLISPPSGHEPPVRVVIASPTQSGTYPVILFKHGFMLPNCYYTQLFESLASSGYIVVAPQIVTLDSNCTEEIEQTAEVANWIPINLAVVLNAALSNENVVPDMTKLVMAGHSRGGKIAFAMVLGMASIEIPSFSALVTLDPVDGISLDSLSYPPLVAAGCNHTRNQISFPVLILGTGYGSEKGTIPLEPACAPACCSHAAYFNCSSAPIMYQLVASDYGHLDFLDSSLIQIITPFVCKSGSSKAPLHEFTSELIEAFLQYALEDSQEAMDDIIENWESASITLEEPQIYTEDDALHVQREHISKTIPQVAAF